MAGNGVSTKGSGTIIINDYTFNNVASGTFFNLELQGDVATRTALGNGGAIISRNFTGKQANVTIKVVAGSLDDAQLTSFYKDQENNFEESPFLSGSYNLITLNSAGRSVQTKYILSGGCIITAPNISLSAEGAVEDMERTWVLGFTADLQNQ